MKDIALVIAVICVCAIICSAVNTLAPQGNSRRILATVMGAFIICTLIVPIKNAVNGFQLKLDDIPKSDEITATADETFENEVIKQTEANLTNTLKKLLYNEKIPYSSCKVKIKNSDSGIYIDSIVIYINKHTDINKIITKVYEKFELRPKVIRT